MTPAAVTLILAMLSQPGAPAAILATAIVTYGIWHLAGHLTNPED